MVSWLIRLAGISVADADTERQEQARNAEWRGVEVEGRPQRQVESQRVESRETTRQEFSVLRLGTDSLLASRLAMLLER